MKVGGCHITLGLQSVLQLEHADLILVLTLLTCSIFITLDSLLVQKMITALTIFKDCGECPFTL